MFNVIKKSIQWGGETLTLETGKVARQADGTVIATLGETSVMANVTFAKSAKPVRTSSPDRPLPGKYYAAGKIPGGFFKRRSASFRKGTLTSRLIDRPCRPLFVDGFKNEVLVMATVLSHDLHNEPDIVAMIAASAALTISGVPFMGPIGAARVGFSNGEYVLNPSVDDLQNLRNNPDQRLDLVIAGTKDAVMMVESEAYELSEAEMLGAVKFGHAAMQPVIDLIIDTSGKIIINASAVFGDSLAAKTYLYADLTQVQAGEARFLFLVDLPESIGGVQPLLSIYGELKFEFVQDLADGSNPAPLTSAQLQALGLTDLKTDSFTYKAATPTNTFVLSAERSTRASVVVTVNGSAYLDQVVVGDDGQTITLAGTFADNDVIAISYKVDGPRLTDSYEARVGETLKLLEMSKAPIIEVRSAPPRKSHPRSISRSPMTARRPIRSSSCTASTTPSTSRTGPLS